MADLSEVAARRAEAEEEWRAAALRDEHRRLIGELRSRRAELGLSQEEVAARVGISRSQIAMAETGGALLSVETLIGYAIAVGARLSVEGGE
jgi:DNA-binding XRE family transcriptional regulator